MKQERVLITSATILNEYICIAGSVISSSHSSVELYDPKLNEWTQMPNVCNSGYKYLISEWNGSLYAIGQNNFIKKFDSFKNSWTLVSEFEFET